MNIHKDSKIMADLLRKGYTMLNLSCPICNNPIFKDKKEELFCAICNRNVIITDQKSIKQDSVEDNKIKDNSLNKISSSNLKFNFELLSKVIVEKVQWLLKLVKDEIQLDQLEIEIKVIREMIEILVKINSLITNN